VTRADLHLLQLAPRWAASPTSGAELRNHHLARRLSRHMRVTHLGFTAPGAAAGEVPTGEDVRFIPVRRHAGYRALDLLRGAIGRVPFSVLNYTQPEMSAALARLLREERFDIVQLESIHLAGYLPVIRAAAHPPRLIVCDWHNIESEVLQRYSETTSSRPRRAYARHAARKLREYERWFVHQCGLHLVVSERDGETLRQYGNQAPVAVIENGVDTGQFASSGGGGAKRHRILFVGAMDYHANVDGVVFFAREVWPRVAAKLPDAIFTIVGRKPTAEVRALAGGERIEVSGTVPDVCPYYGEALIAVAPLRVGGGTRLKILEAMAAGVPVVSTTLGAEGLAAEPGVDYLVADAGDAMAQAILDLALDPTQWERMASAGRVLVQRRYDWTALGDALAERLFELTHSH
jgi:polysaccharide biosynthesis protein PslH